MENSLKTIPLTQGFVALVDDSDFGAVNEFKWCLARRGPLLYAQRSVRKPDGSKTIQLLHQFLLPDAEEVLHLDGYGLNNSRKNLKAGSHKQNTHSFRTKRYGTSSYRGVSKFRNKWRATICCDGKIRHLGVFSLEKNAALAYDCAARELFGVFASPNFPVDK